MKISLENVTVVGSNRVEADASDLRLRPGNFPPRLKTILGGGSTFVARKVECDGGGDIIWVDYKQVAGPYMLRIFND